MRSSTIVLALSTAMLSASQSAPPTFPDMDWTCIKTQPQYTALVPKCAQYCHANGLQNNDCPIDDFICHCKNFWGTASLIEPCSDDPALYQCTQEETLYFVGLAGSFCEFWNATADAAQEAVKRKCGKDCKPSSTKYKSVGTGTPKW